MKDRKKKKRETKARGKEGYSFRLASFRRKKRIRKGVSTSIPGKIPEGKDGRLKGRLPYKKGGYGERIIWGNTTKDREGDR